MLSREQTTTNTQPTLANSKHGINSLDKNSLDHFQKSDQWNNLTEAIESRDFKNYRFTRIEPGSHRENWIQLSPWSKTQIGIALIDKLVDRLHFPEISDRHERIAEALEKTFKWVFNPPQQSDKPWASFIDWLASPSDLYWITGKAGSGKSTLMKYISDNSLTQTYLRRWSQGIPLAMGSFFFWNSGTKMQMTQEGLLQSFLHQALSQRRSLTSRSLPGVLHNLCLSRNFSRPWMWSELVQGLRALLDEADSPVKYFLLIDGLDEFAGDKSDLIALITRFSSCPHVKICVSSRPWVVFEDAYKQKPSLLVQNLTYRDIKHYISTRFDNSPAFTDMKQLDPTYCLRLVEDIATKASGVFLWVVLAVKSLLDGFSNGDRLQDLQERLDLLPPDLEELFRKILDNLDPRYIKHASQLFQIFHAAKTPPTVICLALADEGIEDALHKEIKPLTAIEIRYKAMTMKRRLNSRCKGLLEVGPLQLIDTENLPDSESHTSSRIPPVDGGFNSAQGDALAKAKVQYLHRTVKDFLEQGAIWTEIVAATTPTFNPSVSLYASYLQQLKSLDPQSMDPGQLWDKVTWTLEYAVRAETYLSPPIHIAYLDEINSIASTLCGKCANANVDSTFTSRHAPGNSKLRLLPHWTSTCPRGKYGTTFLSIAVSCNLTGYVSAKLSTGTPLSQKGNRPLLFSAVMDYGIFSDWDDRPHCAHSQPSPKMVELLLDGGANPNEDANERFLGFSPWEEVLKHEPGESKEWEEVHALFLRHGAGSKDHSSTWRKKLGWGGLKSPGKNKRRI